MSRPINEDDVIKIIRMMPPENGITAMIEQGIKQLPSAQRESCKYWDAESNYCTLNRPSAQSEQQWIPVSERLPESYVRVFATVEATDGVNKLTRRVEKAFYIESQHAWISVDDEEYSNIENDRMARVVAWMPLPKPYEG